MCNVKYCDDCGSMEEQNEIFTKIGDIFSCDDCIEMHQCFRCGDVCGQNEFKEVHYISFKFGEFNGVCIQCLSGEDYQECTNEEGDCSLVCSQCFDDVVEIECDLAREVDEDE